ncbi:MAG: SxtJ family membrane protein [Flavobacteriales bacterium]|nr:SxtJ family membrane protein [Flavobacteriales bacterium]
MDKVKRKESILVICLGFIGLFLLSDRMFFLYISLSIGVLSMLSSWLEEKIVWIWFQIGHGLGWVNSKILLTAVFFLIVVPLAFINKLFGKQVITLKKGGSTYYSQRNHEYSKKDLENIW